MKKDNSLPFKPHAGLSVPSTNFQRVRDGRVSLPLYYPVDLTNARSIAAGTALSLPIAGNVFYADPIYDLSGNSQAGIARVHFQDTSIGTQANGTPFTVLPQFITRFPFTQLLIENFAQPGKFLAIAYGVDVDIQPGLSNQVLATIINTVTANVAEQGLQAGVSFKSNTNLAVNTPENILAAASNTGGVQLLDGEWYSGNGANLDAIGSCLAKATAPGTVVDGQILFQLLQSLSFAAIANNVRSKGQLRQRKKIASGLRLDFISTNAENITLRHLDYTTL